MISQLLKYNQKNPKTIRVIGVSDPQTPAVLLRMIFDYFSNLVVPATSYLLKVVFDNVQPAEFLEENIDNTILPYIIDKR